MVRGPGHIDDYEETFAESLKASQEALDFVAMRGGCGLAVVSADSEHVVWWTEADGRVVLRIVAVSDLGVSLSATANHYGTVDLRCQLGGSRTDHPSRLTSLSGDRLKASRRLDDARLGGGFVAC